LSLPRIEWICERQNALGYGRGRGPQKYIERKRKLSDCLMMALSADATMEICMLTEFLTGKALTSRIREVMAGQKPRMCVAFLGPNWVGELFEGAAPSDLQVLCDLKMKITTRAALKEGGAPGNEKLRHLPETEMHAKVYLSKLGAIVCSANASARALSSSMRIEDGVWLDPASDAYSQVKREFKERFKHALPIDKSALESAPEHVPYPAGTSDLPSTPTLVELLRHNPDAFHGIRFVCSTQGVRKELKEATFERLEQDSDDSTETKGKLSFDYFSNWETKESEWPALFFSICRGERGGFYLNKDRHHQFVPGVKTEQEGEPEDVFVAHRVRWEASGAAFGDLPRLASLDQCKEELKGMFPSIESFEDFADKILTGREFAELLFKRR
jgi:hypothetical protein